jgi:hypothetical protein
VRSSSLGTGGKIKCIWNFMMKCHGMRTLTNELHGVDRLEKPQIEQFRKNFPTFYGTQRFITMLTRALHQSLS